MSNKSLIGIEWLDFYKKWVINSINNINPNFEGFYFGFTSRDYLNYLEDDIPNKKVYIYPIYHYLHLKAFSLLGGESFMFFCSQILDKVVITFSGLLTGEILYGLRVNKEN